MFEFKENLNKIKTKTFKSIIYLQRLKINKRIIVVWKRMIFDKTLAAGTVVCRVANGPCTRYPQYGQQRRQKERGGGGGDRGARPPPPSFSIFS